MGKKYRTNCEAVEFWTNQELRDLFVQPDIVKCVKVGRFHWLGHVSRMEEGIVPRKIMTAVLEEQDQEENLE